jgi:hypothetical protein
MVRNDMKTWLRLTIVLFIVGGGFTGFTATISALRIVLAAQVPWISSPYILYKFECGGSLLIFASSGSIASGLWRITEHVGWWAALGAGWKAGVYEVRPWTFGVNLIAIALYILLGAPVRTKRTEELTNAEKPNFWDTVPKPPTL